MSDWDQYDSHVLMEEHDEGTDHIVYRLGMAGTAEILDIVVNSERGVGRGRALVDSMLFRLPCDVSRVYVFCRPSNKIACEFYTALGFYQGARIKGFYPDGAAVIYIKDLT